MDFFAPEVGHIAMYLDGGSKGGKIAARGVMRGLQWWREKVGIEGPVHHSLLQEHYMVKAGHTTQPQDPLEVGLY